MTNSVEKVRQQFFHSVRQTDHRARGRQSHLRYFAICDALLFTPGCPLMAPETKRAGPPVFKLSSDLLKMLKISLKELIDM